MAITGKQISELETYFASAKLPVSLQLDAGTSVSDVRKFVTSHLNVLRNNSDKTIFDVFYDRLLKVKELVK